MYPINYHIFNCLFITDSGLSNGMDVAFVVDVSKRMSTQDVEQIKLFLTNAVSDFDISNTKARVGVILMGTTGTEERKKTILSPTDGYDKSAVLKFIRSIEKQQGQVNFKKELVELEKFKIQNQRNVPNVVVVMSKDNVRLLDDEIIKKKVEQLSKSPDKIIFAGFEGSSGKVDNEDNELNDISVDSVRQLPQILSKVYEQLQNTRGIRVLF